MPPAHSLAELPPDELRAYVQEHGIRCPPDAEHGELLRRIREHQEVLLEVRRQALLDICIWARRPVKKSADRLTLAREIATIQKMNFTGLSDEGLEALYRLRGFRIDGPLDRPALVRALRKAEPWTQYTQRKIRRLMGSVISVMVGQDDASESEDQSYQFLPETPISLKERIEQQGVMGGLKSKIKGAADDYVHEKLDEIEQRIDLKLDEIDRRLGEWRDREIRNRLRIIKLTLIATVVVALLSLGYNYLQARLMSP